MGFSNFMGLMGGMARAGEQVADKTLERMDASAIAKAREEAQIRLEQRTEQAAIAREGRGHKREDFTYKRGLMDEQAKLGEARQFATADEKRKYDLGRTRIPDAIKDSNAIYTGSKEKQDGAAKTSAETEKLKAEVAKIKKESEAIGAGGGITEPQIMARLSVGADMIKARFGMKLDKTGFMMDDSAIQDREGMDKALVLYENRVRAGEQPYAAYESVIKEYNGVASATKAASDERAQRGIDSLNKNKPTLRFKDYTREEFDALPKEEQDKAINQAGQSKEPSPSKDQPVIPKAQLPDGHEKIVNGVTYKWNKSTSQFVESTTPTKPTGLMPQSKLDESPVNKITVSKVPAPLLPNGDKHIVNIPKDGKFYQNVIYRDGADRFEVDADGNRKEVGASVHKNDKPKPETKQTPIVTSKKIVDQNEFDAIPLPKNLKEANSDDIYFERGADGKNIYYTVLGNKKIKLDIKDSI